MKPLHIFLTGNDGYGKPFLTKFIYQQSLTKTLSQDLAVLEKARELLLAPTGIAAIQVDGTTMRTALGIHVGYFETKLSPLHCKMKCSLRNHSSDLKVIIIDQVFMLSNELLVYVYLRLNLIFGSVNLCRSNSYCGCGFIATATCWEKTSVFKLQK